MIGPDGSCPCQGPPECAELPEEGFPKMGAPSRADGVLEVLCV